MITGIRDGRNLGMVMQGLGPIMEGHSSEFYTIFPLAGQRCGWSYKSQMGGEEGLKPKTEIYLV